MRIAILLVAVATLAGCATVNRVASGVTSPFRGDGFRGTASEVEGTRFRTRLNVVSDDRRGFVTATRGAARAVSAAAEAGRLRGVEHCIREFGGSEIAWDVAPGDAAAAGALAEDGALLLRGVCLTR